MAKRKQLADASALEAVVAEDPTDQGRWSVLQDFLLEHEDPRSAVELARGEQKVTAARDALMSQLFGPKHATVLNRFQSATWRGAYLRDVDYFFRSEDQRLEKATLEVFLGSPASALLGRLAFGHGEPTALMMKTVAGLSDRPLARSLRSIELATQSTYRGKREFDLAAFARLPVLEELSIAARLAKPTFQPALGDRLVTFAVTTDAAALFPDDGYPRLRDLTLALTGSEPIFSGRATPRLEILRVTGDGNREAIVDALATSALLPRLRELHLQPSPPGWGRWVACAPKKLGPAFAHLSRVVVHRDSIWARR